MHYYPRPMSERSTPVPVPQAEKPLRIAILGWASLHLQAREGSGYNLSASELAAGLVMRGHEVHYLASGMKHRPWPAPYITTRKQPWRGVVCWDLINSATQSPAAVNFGNLAREVRSPAQCRLVVRWLDRIGAQIVHIHSLEGQPLDLIAAIRASGRPVIVTLHNYWFICPQVDLLHQEVRICDDYQGGARCEGCMKRRGYWQVRLARTVGWVLESSVGPTLADAARKLIYGTVDVVRNGRPRAATTDPPPDPLLWQGHTPPPDHDGCIEHNLTLEPHEMPKELGCAPLNMNERFLGLSYDTGQSQPSTASCVHLRVVNAFGQRRLAGIEALNHANLVIPPSDFVRQTHVMMGLDPSHARVVRLGQPHFDQINRCARSSAYYNATPWRADATDRPLAFAFFGTTRHNKGLEILIRAIDMLDSHVRQRARFLIRASGWDWPMRKRMSRFPQVQFAGGYDILQLIAAGAEYDVGILPHIWFENSPLVLLEHLHAGKMVIASRLGGPVEWIIEPGEGRTGERCGYNGLMFPGGDPAGLAACITRLVRGDVAIPSPADIHAATPYLHTYPQHVLEVERVYGEVMAESRAVT